MTTTGAIYARAASARQCDEPTIGSRTAAMTETAERWERELLRGAFEAGRRRGRGRRRDPRRLRPMSAEDGAVSEECVTLTQGGPRTRHG